MHLTKTEYALLEAFVTNPGKLLTHQWLLRKVWGPGYAEESHYLRVYVRSLRRKLGDQASAPRLILTEPGVGYRLDRGTDRWRPVVASPPVWPPTTRPGSSVLKRAFVGRAMASSHLEHTLLPKILALPVFSSDALSSVAYATEEIMIVLLAASANGKSDVFPISIAIATLMAIVVISYRQTVRAYPNGGGAYIVSKDNLGTGAGLVAAAALLVDYMMTVVVSIVAGVFAITSAAPSLVGSRVWMSVGFVIFITLANLRGVRESGTLFAIPTYGFVVSILLMIGLGIVKCFGGCPPSEAVQPRPNAATTVAGDRVVRDPARVLLGSDGAHRVSRPSRTASPRSGGPQAKNAAETLAIMGVIAITMFLGISWLATHIRNVTVSDERSVLAQIAWAVFGGGFGFYVLSVLHRGDPDPGREHRVPGLPPALVDPRA